MTRSSSQYAGYMDPDAIELELFDIERASAHYKAMMDEHASVSAFVDIVGGAEEMRRGRADWLRAQLEDIENYEASLF